MRSSSAKTASVVQSAWLQDARFDLDGCRGNCAVGGSHVPQSRWSLRNCFCDADQHTWLFGYEHLAAYTRLFGRPEIASVFSV